MAQTESRKVDEDFTTFIDSARLLPWRAAIPQLKRIRVTLPSKADYYSRVRLDRYQ
jgi:hypothetical protein